MRSLLFLAAVSALAFAGDADGHAFLAKAEPAVGSAVPMPKTLRVEFSEGVELRFSGVEVSGPSGEVTIRNLRFDGGDRKVLLADLPQLAPGNYRVKWHVVSVDTHRTEGNFAFAVKP